MIDNLSRRFNRASDIYQQEGFAPLFERVFTILRYWLSYEKNTFYVSKVVLHKGNEADFLPKIRDFTCKIVEKNQQLNELSNDGFDLSLLDITKARQRLEKGAVALLIFVGSELAYQGWEALTEEAKNTFNSYPYKVDFSNNEACSGGTWTNPRYRRQGLNKYGIYKRQEYLMAKGIKTIRTITQENNIDMLRVHEKMDEKWGVRRAYSKAHYLRIGRLQFWKETPVESIKNNN